MFNYYYYYWLYQVLRLNEMLAKYRQRYKECFCMKRLCLLLYEGRVFSAVVIMALMLKSFSSETDFHK